MKNKQNSYKQFSLKLSINALSICFLSLMALPLHADDKAAAAITAAVAAAPRAPNNKSNKPEAVVKEIPANIKTEADIRAEAAAMAAVVAAVAALGLPDNVINKPEVVVAEIPADVKAAVEKKLISKIKIIKAKIDPAATQVFRTPIYKARPMLDYFAVVDGEAVDLSYYGTPAILAGYLKLIRDDFVLDSEEKANLLANAFQHAFPYKLGRKVKPPVKLENGWLLIRDEFFKKHSGLVFTTDEKGKITLVEYVFSIKPEDYSYDPLTKITL